MRISRARYVTICQQFLVTAVVLVVGLSAAGVMTLQIVAPERPQASGMAPAIKVSDAYVDTAPVTPKVREVKVQGIDPQAARDIPGVVTAPKKKTKTLAALSAPTPVRGYATVGVTWKAGTQLTEDQISVQVRTRKGDTWSGWTTAAYHDDHGPDAGTAEADKVRPGTDAVVVGDVDEVQMRAETDSGQAPSDLELAVVDPGTGEMKKEPAAIDTAKLPSSAKVAANDAANDAAKAASSSNAGDVASLSAMTVTPRPVIYSRAQWGANEALRDKSSLRYGTIQTGFIHHTVNANDYTPEQVPALLRGIYAYHTQSRGWSDIGYNFLVDRFGRIWEGRYGGVDRPVVGAHTLGYNEYSFAMSAIGNFDIVQPPQVMLDAYAQLFAWKLSLSNIRADANHLWVKDRYLYAINGHRDVGKTACPGKYLYAKIPAVRAAAQVIENNAQTPIDPVTLPPIATPPGTPSPVQAPAPAPPQPAISFPQRTSVAGSGWPDLLAMNSAGTISVVPTEGVLDYTTRVVNGPGWNKMSLIAAVGDVTGDGKADVLARNKKSGVTRVYPGDGQGHVTHGVAPTNAFARVKMFVGARDLNRDKKVDVVGRDRKSGALLLYRGTGKGTFKAPTVLRKKWPYQETTGVGDLNGDKWSDLVVTAKDGRGLLLFPGASHGTKLGKPVRLATLPTAANALMGWGDLTGDGHPDVMARMGSNTTLLSGTGQGLGQTFGPYGALAGLTQVSLAPMGGSKGADAVGRDAAGHLVVVLNNGAQNTSAPLPSNLTVGGVSQVLDVGDWDRNGTADVVVRVGGGDQLVLYPGLGNGKFGQPRSLGTGWKAVTRLAAVGDVTGDGYPDLLGATASGMTIFPGFGVNAFHAPVLAPASLRTYNQIGAAPWSPGGAVFASADGGFVPLSGTDPASALRMANGSVTATYDTYVGVGDVNGDGVADLLARESGTGNIWLLPGKTSGGLAPRMWVASGYAGYQLVG
ncbi:MAG: VCBS repeat-containing protein [Propionibacteriales bacterium]|nr:VCBS repeat-containing protein [Propionibacteriales bacterium]